MYLVWFNVKRTNTLSDNENFGGVREGINVWTKKIDIIWCSKVKYKNPFKIILIYQWDKYDNNFDTIWWSKMHEGMFFALN